MNNKRIPAAALALASLLSVSAVFADEMVVTAMREPASMNADEMNRELAKKANTSAVERAVAAVLADTRLDLDIRLIGPTSVKVTDER